MLFDTGYPDPPAGASWSPGLRPPGGRITARLAPVVSTGTYPAPRVTVANLHLAEREVHARATALAERVRMLSAGHSMRIWRDAHRDALVELAREATGVGSEAACERLSWDLDSGVYHVSATYSAAPSTVH
jgi:imidazolonepropionase-like amidohydrolase